MQSAWAAARRSPGAGAGVSTTNKISAQVKAYIDGDITTGISATSITVKAQDVSTITSNAGAAALAISFSGGASVSVSVAATVASNSVGNTVEAYIQNAGTAIRATAGAILLQAQESSSITSLAIAASAAAAISPASLAVSGSGVQASNTLSNDVEAFIANSNGGATASGSVTVSAMDTATVDAEIDSASVAAGVVGIAVGESQSFNTIGDTVNAYINNSTVTASGGDLSVTASSTPTITTSTAVLAVSAAIGGAGAGASATTTINGTTEASIGGGTFTASGHQVKVTAFSSATLDPSAAGASGGLLSVTALVTDAEIHGTTQASVGGTTGITASGLVVSATDTSVGTPSTAVAGVGALTGAGASSTTIISRVVSAFVADGAHITVGTGTVSVMASSTNTANGTTTGLTAGAIDITALVVDMEMHGRTTASVGDGVILGAGSLSVTASASDTVTSDTTAFGVGLASGTGVSLTALDTSTVDAHVGPTVGSLSAGTATQVTTSGGVTVAAGMVSTVVAQADATSISLLVSGASTSTHATASPTVLAYLGDQVQVSAGGDVQVTATAQASALALGMGFSASGGISASGASVGSIVDPIVSAFTASGGSVSGANVTFQSLLNVTPTGAALQPVLNGSLVGPAYASLTLGSAGLLAGVSGGTITVDNSPTLIASVGAGTSVTASGAFTLQGEAYQLSQADAASASGGLAVGVGVIQSSVTAAGTITTTFNGDLLGSASALIQGETTATSRVEGRAGGGGVGGAVTDVTISASTSPQVHTTVNGNLSATGSVSVQALATTDARADAASVGFSFGATAGLVTVTAFDHPNVLSEVITDSIVSSAAGTVTVLAGHNYDPVSGTFASQQGAEASTTMLSVSIGVSLGITNVSATDKPVVNATVDSGAVARAEAGAVNVLAKASNYANASSSNSGGAALNFPQSNSNADVGGTTDAALLGSVVDGLNASAPGAGSVTVSAQAADVASAGSDSSGGGLISVSDSSEVTATSEPNLLVHAGGTIIASGDITITSQAFTDADSISRSDSGGAVNISDLTAASTVKPVVTTQVNSGAVITSGGTLTISATNGQVPPVYSDGSFNAASAVNTSTNTINLGAAHGLETGDTIVYSTGGGTNVAIGGLVNGRTYGVIVPVDGSGNPLPNALQLGVTFNAATGVNLVTDTISFAVPHNLQNGDRVVYQAGNGERPGGRPRERPGVHRQGY